MERDIGMQCTPAREHLPVLQEQQILYLLVELLPAAVGEDRTRLPLDICLLLDCSSSMRGDRLFQAKEAATYIVKRLTPEDYFCLIAFNDRATVVIPRQQVVAPAAIREHVVELEASGGTEMARGMEQVLEQMFRVAVFSGVRRIILLTDGQTYGDEDRCVELARKAQKAGIGITAFGLGDAWNEDLLATMAAYGNSHSEYITSAESIVQLFQEEMRLLQGIMAQDMSLLVRPYTGVTVHSFFRVSPEVAMVSLRETWDEGQEVPLGEWMGDDLQAFVAELVVPPLSPGQHRLFEVLFSFRAPRERSRRELRYELRLPCVHGEPLGSAVPDKVRRGLEKVTAFRLQEAAWQEVRRGNIDQATRRLEAAATRLVKMGEQELAQVIEEEARRLRSTGRISAGGKKEIIYGTQRLGRRRSGRR